MPFLYKSKYTFNDKNIYINEGLSYYRLKDYKRAKQSLFTALRMYPNLLLPRLWLAEIYLHTGRNAEALNKLREIIEIQPKEFSREVTVIKRDAEMLLNRVLENKSTR